MTHLIYTLDNCFKGELVQSDDRLTELKTTHSIFVPTGKITLIEEI